MSESRQFPQAPAKLLKKIFQQTQGKLSKHLKATKIRKRIRGTAIVDTPQGVLLVSTNGDRFSLPGGGAEKQEKGEAAAIRELKEETGLKAISAQYLFSHVGKIRKRSSGGLARNHHEVFLIQAKGKPQPKEEIKAIAFCQFSEIPIENRVNISDSAKHIINKYWALKESGLLQALNRNQQL
ncbi:MAG: NUDIX domain-containing protein [Drouetiella hepatica Uher 2000/2452]|uniref:NUDIX domain-containing protein n=1 Tax=Drouetiella hepatica Uher 2000/2452 TaxID=904376 RepID=A0A951ULX4_9CYAN|nr:NUDIX domain-containing protein [Drouetiella hepatica Uher 2000/2452]